VVAATPEVVKDVIFIRLKMLTRSVKAVKKKIHNG
jgi:hypothetical protein